MADPRFFPSAGPLALGELAEIAGAELEGTADSGLAFDDVAPLDTAGPRHVGFLDNKLYTESFRNSRAGACLVHPDMVRLAPSGMALLVTREPYHGYAKVARAFHPEPALVPGIHPVAAVDPTARLGAGCQVDAGAAIGARAEVGARCRIGANAVIGDGVVVGDDCRIGPRVALACCLVGHRVTIHAGTSIGQDGFGFAMGPKGHLKVPQLGRVIVEDDVEIGANCAIDRGAGPDTIIGAGTKIDNLVQIGHNVRLGRNCVIVSQVGISGSTTVGDFAIMAGQAGLTGHLTIGSGARIAAQAGVMRDVAPGETVGGSPAMPQREWLKSVAMIERMVRKKKGA
ncbi:MAG: UDP-3-O-(3-hydroxymyristoyl)glucosamine N-acyltransferase [Magnetospirillum sp. WYHS-4]